MSSKVVETMATKFNRKPLDFKVLNDFMFDHFLLLSVVHAEKLRFLNLW